MVELRANIYLPNGAIVERVISLDKKMGSVISDLIQDGLLPVESEFGKPYSYGITIVDPTIYLDHDETISLNLWEYYGFDSPPEHVAKLRIVTYFAVKIVLPSGRYIDLNLNAQYPAGTLVVETLRQLGSLPISREGEIFYPGFYCVRLGKNLGDSESLVDAEVLPGDTLIVSKLPIPDSYESVFVTLSRFGGDYPDYTFTAVEKLELPSDIPIQYFLPELLFRSKMPLNMLMNFLDYDLVVNEQINDPLSNVRSYHTLAEDGVRNGDSITPVLPGRGGGAGSPAPSLLTSSPLITSAKYNDVRFSTFYPRMIQPNTVYTIPFYIHLPDEITKIESDMRQSAQWSTAESSGALGSSKTGTQLIKGATLTITPRAKGFSFTPRSVDIDFSNSIEKVSFSVSASEEVAGELVIGSIAVALGVIEIASISFAIEVLSPSKEEFYSSALDFNTGSPYRSIFISYSRKDQEIVYHVASIYEILGDECFVDRWKIRSGELWKERIKTAIEQADVFNLCWSRRSSRSKACRFEWRYALKVKKNRRDRHFIRPWYWKEPIPDPPVELSKIHFTYREIKS